MQEIEKYARIYNVPIMEKEGIEFITKYIQDNNVKSILEIGTAIGYSALKMASINDDITVTSIERDQERYEIAVENIARFNMEDRIELIFGDALEIEIEGKYDLIFIDAAKSQSIKFFTKYEPNLKKDGTIITDNINFHGLTFSDKPADTRNVRQLIRKIRTYLEWLEKNPDFETEYHDIGDGVIQS